MIVENLDTIKLYNKIVETKRKIRIVKSPYNVKLILYFDNKLVGTFSNEKLKDLGLIK